ncbi:MAG TPA: carboxylating nicotinate-nucleotide diphosphorylase [Symbiobacteriaceae bacterium]
MNWHNPLIRDLVIRALQEDIGTGDITTDAVVPPDRQVAAHIRAKADGVIAGLPLLPLIFRELDPQIRVEFLVSDGQAVTAGTTLARLEGSARAILTGERLALNFLQRLSGIATHTARLAEQIKFYSCRLTDTRKTTPGLRILEKYAVSVGGGFNHRFGLYDAVLIKDNHIAVAGGIFEAVSAVRKRLGHTVKIEVEVETLEQVAQALESRVDIIMLDNMPVEMMKQAVKMIDGRAVVEASGCITEENIQEVAKTGVDYISVGALTHHIRALDISLEIEPEPARTGTDGTQ